MANAKTYNDLNQATEVNDTDKLALAQSDKQELVTATVGQVAQKVANIVSTDQVTEIVTDLGMGKQIMAQTLQDKGVDTTASDTLSQMATKLSAVDVVGAKEYILGDVLKLSAVTKKSFTCQAGFGSPNVLEYTAKSLKILKAEDGGEVTTVAEYTNDSMPAWEESKTLMITSANGQYVMLWPCAGSSTPSTVYIFQADYTNNTLTLVTSVSVPTYASSGYLLYISNDGTKAFAIYKSTSAQANKSFFIDIATSTVTSLPAFTNLTDITFSTYAACYNFNNNTLLVCPDLGGYGGYDEWSTNDFYIASVNFTNNTFTVLGGYTYKSEKHRCGWPVHHHSSNTIFISYVKNYSYDSTNLLKTYKGSYATATLYAIDATDFSVLDTVDYSLYDRSLYGNQYVTYSAQLAGPSPVIVPGTETNDIKITVGYFCGIVFNTTTKKFDKTSVEKISYTVPASAPSGAVGRKYLSRACVCTPSGITKRLYLIEDYYSSDYGAGAINAGYRNITEIIPHCSLGYIYKRNGQSVPLILPVWSDADYEAGAYDIDNTTAEVKI